MSDQEVMRWKFGDVAARLLDGRMQPNPPPDWVCWKEPVPALSIDDQIATLIRRNAHPRLRSRSELEDRGVTCPYYGIRFAIAVAVGAATETAAEDPIEMVERWRAQEQAALRTAAENAILAETLLQPARRPAPRLPFLESSKLIEAHKAVLRHKGACERIIDDARRWQQIYQHTRGEPWDVWRKVFVADLGVAWTVLTGTPPARGEKFTGFVDAAYASIFDAEVLWDSSIRAVVELDLDWHDRGLSFAEIQKRFSDW